MCHSFISCVWHFLVSSATLKCTKRRRPCVFCRGDWYAQGNHARDAASRRRPGDDEDTSPHRQVGTFVYSSPWLCLPFRTITSLSTEYNGILPHSPETYKSPQKNTQNNEKCDSVFYRVAFSNAAIMRETRDFTWRTVAAGRFIRRATFAQLSPVARSSR